MKKLFHILLSALLLAPMLTLSSRAFADGVNLIANPSVETAVNALPANWTSNSWGTNSPSFTYDTAGHTGVNSLAVSVTAYISGDAKWIPDQSAVAAGQTYTYSDFSTATVPTELDVAYYNAAGGVSFAYLTTVPASSSWQQTTTTFTVPAGIVGAAVYHIMYSNGTLNTDDFSLTTGTAPAPTPAPVPIPTPTPTPTPIPNPSPNLIINSSFETANGTDPSDWARGGWGTNAPTYTYNSGSAHTGTRSASVSLTSITTGDVKWFATPIAVSAGTYSYQDYYTASVSTRMVVALTSATGVVNYVELASAPTTTGWTLYITNITVPAGTQTITLLHLLDKIGTLTIDDVSLVAGAAPAPTPTPTPTPSSGLIPNASFETANGAQPANWTGESWGTNTPKFTYVTNDAHSGTSSAKVTVSGYSSGDAKWAFTPITTLTPGGQYRLSAWYKTNTQPRVVAAYKDTQGVDQYITMTSPLPPAASTTVWQQYSSVLNVPMNAVSVTVFFLIAGNGWLQTDDFNLVPSTPVGFNAPLISLTFDDGWSSIYTNGLPVLKKYGFVSTQYLVSSFLNKPDYMTTSQAKAFQTAGHEIASHTVTHSDLTKLSATQVTTELSKSQTTLRQLFGPNVAQNFASPYGSYNASSITKMKLYYQSHRSTDVGYNTKDNFDPYNIVVQNVDTTTTPAEVASWVTKAKADKAWLVLVYHAVLPNPTQADYGVTPADLDTELSNIKASGVSVQTVAQAIATIRSQP